MNWRLYRVPGSREVWHVDQGDGTFIVNVKGFEIYCRAHSVDIGDGNPRAWIAIPIVESDLHIINGIAVWSVAQCRASANAVSSTQRSVCHQRQGEKCFVAVAEAEAVATAVPTGTHPAA